MEFGKEQYPKWTDKEEMTLIFLSALRDDWTTDDIIGEINALFGNNRSREAVTDRINKNGRAIEALRDLVVSNPVVIAKFWKRSGVVDSDVSDPEKYETMIVCDADAIREVISRGGWPEGQVNSLSARERHPNTPTLYDKLRRLFPEINADMSEDALIEEVKKLQVKAVEPPIRVTKVTRDSIEIDDDLSLAQLRAVLIAINEA
jgi:hypothetical protein